MKTFLKLVLAIFIVGFSIIFFMILIWGFPGMSYEIPGGKLTEVYKKIGNYSIGNEKFRTNICNKEDGCLNGKILGLKQKQDDIYLFIEINYGSGSLGINENKRKFYAYELYKNTDRISVTNLYDLPKFGFLSNNELNFYSENDLQNITQEQQNIFKELEENPKIIIDGINYVD